MNLVKTSRPGRIGSARLILLFDSSNKAYNGIRFDREYLERQQVAVRIDSGLCSVRALDASHQYRV